jgi:hypothetical protein
MWKLIMKAVLSSMVFYGLIMLPIDFFIIGGIGMAVLIMEDFVLRCLYGYIFNSTLVVSVAVPGFSFFVAERLESCIRSYEDTMDRSCHDPGSHPRISISTKGESGRERRGLPFYVQVFKSGLGRALALVQNRRRRCPPI